MIDSTQQKNAYVRMKVVSIADFENICKDKIYTIRWIGTAWFSDGYFLVNSVAVKLDNTIRDCSELRCPENDPKDYPYAVRLFRPLVSDKALDAFKIKQLEIA